MKEKLMRIKRELEGIDEREMSTAELHIWDIVKDLV